MTDKQFPVIEIGKEYKFIHHGHDYDVVHIGKVVKVTDHDNYLKSYHVIETDGEHSRGGYLWYTTLKTPPFKTYYFDEVIEND